MTPIGYWGASLVAVIVLGVMAVAGSAGGVLVGTWPLFATGVGLAIAIQWLAFIHSYLAQTEHFFDLTGSATYIGVVWWGLLAAGHFDTRSLVLVVLVTLWAIRLGTFLFGRIRRAGSDRRFKNILPDPAQLFMTWTLQALWVVLAAGPALAALSSPAVPGVDGWLVAGAALWVAGFGIEVVADRQKQQFRADPDNAGRFIAQGLWAWSRHPNYFGEILLWVGIAVIALPALSGWQHLTLVSPVFVWLLLTRISGVRMLEARADRLWGDDPDYQVYKSATPSVRLRRPRPV